MERTKKVCKIFFLLTIMCSLTGCWDRQELENKAYVIGLGIDPSKYEGKIKVTMLIANPEVGSMQGGGGSTEKPKEIISFDANDFLTAKGTANAIISREISYELLKVLIFSEEFAKGAEFIPTLNDALKDKEIRLDNYLAICKEKAHDYFLKNHPRMETRPHKYFQYMIKHGIDNGFIPDSTLFRFFRTYQRGADLALVMYTSTERQKDPEVRREDEYMAGEINATGEIDNTQFIGAAAFKNGEMIGKLTGEETRMINILDDTTEMKDILISFPDPFSEKKEQMSARILKKENNHVKMNIKNIKPEIYITVPLVIEILSNPSMISFANKYNQDKVKNYLSDYLETLMIDVIKRSQKELKGVPYPLSLSARRYFLTIPEYEKFDWPQSYLDTDVHIKMDIEIVDFGKLIKKQRETEE